MPKLIICDMKPVSDFFVRIGLSPDLKITKTGEFLKTIQLAAVTHIAYENLDILDGIPISLEPQTVYDKIVSRKRGGYCFEVNGLLADMLKNMGFDVKEYFARYLRGEEGTPMRRHRVLAVTADDGTYLMDIGIGQSAPRLPLRLEYGSEQTQFGETYRFERDPMLGTVLFDLHNGKWRQFFSFTDDLQFDVDFVQPSFWCEHHPDSPFNKQPMIAIKTSDGRKTVDGRTYKVFHGDTLAYIEENVSDERFFELLKEEFLIDYPG